MTGDHTTLNNYTKDLQRSKENIQFTTPVKSIHDRFQEITSSQKKFFEN